MPIRADILQAAAKVFQQKGYDRATLEDIAAMVNMKKGSLYYHINSKEQLLEEIHTALDHELWEQTTRAISCANDPAGELSAVIAVILALIDSHPQEVVVFTREFRSLNAQQLRKVERRRTEYIHLVEDIVIRGVKSGQFRPVNTKMVALGVLGMANRAADWYNPLGTQTAPEIAKEFADMLIFGLLPRED